MYFDLTAVGMCKPSYKANKKCFEESPFKM